MWQPIETAPKVHTDVLITDGTYTVVAHWSKKNGWRVSWSHDFFSESGEDATHWMPLPPPPIIGSAIDESVAVDWYDPLGQSAKWYTDPPELEPE